MATRPAWQIARSAFRRMELVCRDRDLLAVLIDIVRECRGDERDICGLCGQPGADKIPHPIRWPGEESPGSELVHAECEDRECRRAHAALSDEQRRRFLQTI